MLFSKKVEESRFLNFQKNIKKSFDKIKYEVNLSYKWITNLNNRVSNIENNDSSRLIKDLEVLKEKNESLTLKNDELKNMNSQLYSKLNEVILYLHKIDPKINKIQKIENDIETKFKELKSKEKYFDNLEKISKEDKNKQIEFGSSFEKIYKILENQNEKISKIVDYQVASSNERLQRENTFIQKEVKVDNKDLKVNAFDIKLSKSETALLYSLLNSNIEMSYLDLSNDTGLNYGTIKNIMYNLRKKNIDIPFILNDKKEKLYYLDNELMLKITGR